MSWWTTADRDGFTAAGVKRFPHGSAFSDRPNTTYSWPKVERQKNRTLVCVCGRKKPTYRPVCIGCTRGRKQRRTA
jgi:hypothetical protein